MRAIRSRRALAATTAALLVIALVSGTTSARPGPVLSERSWIVTLKVAAVTATERIMAADAGGRAGLIYGRAINGFQFLGSEAAANALRRNPNVRTVEQDRPVFLTETLPYGVKRIDAYVPGSPGGAYQAGYRGSGARIAIIDTGIDLTHPDLAASLDVASGVNCVDPSLPPDDGYGHGTHVAGSAAAPLNGIGVVGVAPEATLVPIKVFDDAGNSSEALVLCGLDRVISLNTDADPSNDIDVASMSFGESRAWGDCASEAMHQAICNAAATGVVLVGGAGNSSADAGSFVPAAFPEVISVSALADFDGQPGGLAGCGLVPDLGWFECDDTFAFFSNYGPSVDVIAPGVSTYSTWKDGGYYTSSGTSMATPHVSGVAALMKAVNPALTGADVLALLRQTGECPDGSRADADGVPGCAGQGQWPDDPDGIAEPLANALQAASAAAGVPPPPPQAPGAPTLAAASGDGQVNLTWNAPANGGSPITGYVLSRGLASGALAEYAVLGSVLAFSDVSVTNGTTYYYQVAAVNAIGAGPASNEVAATPAPPPTPSPTPSPTPQPWDIAPQGNWVGVYGADGYALMGWNSTSDVIVMPRASLVLDQGSRYRWSSSTTDVRALENETGTLRRASQWFHSTSLRFHLTFPAAYSGRLHLYALDWDGTSRRETVFVDDGSGVRSVFLNSSFHNGAWLNFPISVGDGGTVTVRVDRSAGNATLSGLFLGGAGLPTATPSPTPSPTPVPTPTPTPTPVPMPTPTPTPTPTPVPTPVPWDVAPQGDWVGTYGADGYALLGWNKTSDVVAMPYASLTLDQGGRYRWSSSTTDVRALEDATQTTRRASQWYHKSSLRLHLTFAAPYSGTLHLYALDWDGTSRREIVYVDDGSGTRSVYLNSSFHNGAWLNFPVSVGAGGTVTVRVDRIAGNATLSGIFLGGA